MTPAVKRSRTLCEIRLDLPEPPSVNHYYAVVRGRKILSAAGRAYKIAVRAAYLREFRTTQVAIAEGPVMVQYVWTRGRKSGDLLNREKALMDALNGLAFTDDSQIVECHAYRKDDKGHPGIVVVVARANPSALFPFTEGEQT